MKKYLPLMVSGALMIFIGLYMLLHPDGFLTVVISAFGVYLALDGVRTLYAAIKLGDVIGRSFRKVAMGKAFLNMLVGLFVIIIAIAAPTLIPNLLVYIIAAAFLITGAVDLADMLLLSKAGVVGTGLGLETVLSFVFAILLFLFPSFLTGIVMTLFAAILLASGALMVYGSISSMVFSRRLRKDGESF